MDTDGRSRSTIQTFTFVIAILFLFVWVAMIIIGIIYVVHKPTTSSGSPCSANNECGINQTCQAGKCGETLCASNTDCSDNAICVNSYCISYNCSSGNDCPFGMACVNNTCLSVGTSCASNTDCNGLSCMNSMCVQCLANSNCPVGQGCFNQACRYPYDGETGPNLINYTSAAQFNGNITAPPGYFCTATVCGTGPDPIYCGTTGSSCPSSCPFCVNGLCRCTAGAVTELCSTNTDCVSKVCIDSVCFPSGGNCIGNYDGIGGTGLCTALNPYCVNGVCSNTSLGAICGATGMPPDLCYNPQSLGAVGTTGINPEGMGFFCVDGFCQQQPGGLNDQCTSGSCTYIQDNILTCTPVITPTITEFRCLS